LDIHQVVVFVASSAAKCFRYVDRYGIKYFQIPTKNAFSHDWISL